MYIPSTPSRSMGIGRMTQQDSFEIKPDMATMIISIIMTIMIAMIMTINNENDSMQHSVVIDATSTMKPPYSRHHYKKNSDTLTSETKFQNLSQTMDSLHCGSQVHFDNFYSVKGALVTYVLAPMSRTFP